MTENQRIFCEEYLKDRNGTRAYKVAYPNVKKDGAARTNAKKLLGNKEVQDFIQERLDEIHSELTADASEPSTISSKKLESRFNKLQEV